jgi:DHA1 family inner membrane transport protein
MPEEPFVNTEISATAATADLSSTARWALVALAIGAFGIGTTEFSPMGLLPVIAQGVDVSIPTAGLLISAYAVGVMVGAPIMTLAFRKALSCTGSHRNAPTSTMRI